MKQMSDTLPETVKEKTDNAPEVTKQLIEYANDDKLTNTMFEILNSSSIEYKNSDKKKGSEYDREVDLYALVDNEDMDLFDYLEAVREQYEPPVNITPLGISVRSAKAKMNMAIDLEKMAKVIANAIEVNINQGEREDFSIRGVLYNDIHAGEIKKPGPRKTGQFPNNMAVLIRSPFKIEGAMYIRVFKNGSISMTGCKITEDGIAVIRILEKFLIKHPSLFSSKAERNKFKINKFELTMINSNYLIGFKIDRTRTFDFFDNKTDLFCSYKPGGYAGVKIGFFYNTMKDVQDGVCICKNRKCTLKKSTSGKGTGSGEDQCKKVTISMFETGKVVITGGRNVTQAMTAYNFINEIIKENAKEIALIKITETDKDCFTLTN